MKSSLIGRILGPLLFVGVLFFTEPAGMTVEAKAVLASTLWVATWWITEAMPIPVTALLPILLFSFSGAMEMKAVTSFYGHPFIFLFMGGFMIAKALERWNLHKRMALGIIHWIGTDVRLIVLGFMIATAFLSMWISNTATTVMMLPIGLAVITKVEQDREVDPIMGNRFGKTLMLAIAYAASIGGVATLIGTPPNLVLAGIMKETFDVEISFMKWMIVGLPFSAVMLYICWQYLTRVAFKLEQFKLPGGRDSVKQQLQALGKISYEEKAVGMVFGITALAWVCKSFLLKPFFPEINDTLIALIGGVSLFLIPSKSRSGSIINWDEAVSLPWGVLLLYGGGLAIAGGFQTTGLAVWIGNQMTLLEGVHLGVIILIIVMLINFLTEITSNLATTAMLLPVFGALATSIGINPFLILVSATIAASCAFMLPVATPPNAVVFGSGKLEIQDMVKTGLWMNLISILVVSLMGYLLVPLIWGLYTN